MPTDSSVAGALASPARPDDELPEPQTTVHMPGGVRSMSLAVLALLGCVFALRWASPVLIPVMLGVMFSCALSPLVDWLQRWRVPRALASAFLMIGIIVGAGATVYSLADEAVALIESLPDAAKKLRDAVRPDRSKPHGPIDKVQKAAAQLEQAAREAGGVTVPGKGLPKVQIEQVRFNVSNYLWVGTVGLISLIAQGVAVFFITFFLVASGNTFRRKLVKIAGPTFTNKKITVQALDEITTQIQRYLLQQLFASFRVGIATWLAFRWLGLENAEVWGIAAGVLNLVPYLGSIALTACAALVAFLQFGGVEPAVLVGGVSLLIHVIDGYLILPWLTSRVGRMSPVVVFIGVLAWGWLWGGWGLLLGVPILMIVKAVCERVDDLKPLGELLGD